jgi:hypothetical protein
MKTRPSRTGYLRAPEAVVTWSPSATSGSSVSWVRSGPRSHGSELGCAVRRADDPNVDRVTTAAVESRHGAPRRQLDNPMERRAVAGGTPAGIAAVINLGRARAFEPLLSKILRCLKRHAK